MNPRYPAVARRADHRCEYCRAPEDVSGADFDVKHIFPAGRGGSSDPGNLALSCRRCNLLKGGATESSDPDSGVTVELFNPRADRWSDHFRVDLDSWEVIGLTPTGRATVAALDLNGPKRLVARELWSGLKLFP